MNQRQSSSACEQPEVLPIGKWRAKLIMSAYCSEQELSSHTIRKSIPGVLRMCLAESDSLESAEPPILVVRCLGESSTHYSAVPYLKSFRAGHSQPTFAGKISLSFF